MTLIYVTRLFIFTLLLVLVFSDRGSGWNQGGNRGGGEESEEDEGRGGSRGGNRGSSDDEDDNQGGKGGGNQGGGDDEDEDSPIVCYLGRTGNFYDGVQSYFGGGGCGCQYGPTRNALRELAVGYLMEFNRHLVDNYPTPSNSYSTGRFERWFGEFATRDVQYTTSTGTSTTFFDGLNDLTDEDTGFGYLLATGDLDYRVEISPTIMTECSADGLTASFRGLLTIYRIDRDTDCLDGIQQTRSMFTFEGDDDGQWLVSVLRFVRDDIPEECDA